MLACTSPSPIAHKTNQYKQTQSPRVAAYAPETTTSVLVSQEQGGKSKEQRGKRQEARGKRQEARAKSQEPRAKSQEPRAKSHANANAHADTEACWHTIKEYIQSG